MYIKRFNSFINEKMYQPSYINKFLKEKYKDVIAKLFIFENEKSLELNIIIIKKEFQNKGYGKKILNDLIEYSNKENKIIHLTPTNEFGSNVENLKKFYKSFGFVFNKGFNKDFTIKDTMIRYPN